MLKVVADLNVGDLALMDRQMHELVLGPPDTNKRPKEHLQRAVLGAEKADFEFFANQNFGEVVPFCFVVDELLRSFVPEKLDRSVVTAAHQNVKLWVVVHRVVVKTFVRNKVLQNLIKVVVAVPDEYYRI